MCFLSPIKLFLASQYGRHSTLRVAAAVASVVPEAGDWKTRNSKPLSTVSAPVVVYKSADKHEIFTFIIIK